MQLNTPHIGKVTLGADPELFLTQNGNFRSAIGYIGGSKEYPRALGDRPGFFIQEDNVAVEFNIPPAISLQEWCDSIQWAKSEISKEVNKFGFDLAVVASALFPPLELQNPQALMFGCTPDYNAWKNGRRNPRPRSKDARLRSCGGHIHVGYSTDSTIDKHRAIQLMDLYLGVPSVMMDEDQQRRKLYGKAGAYRDTEYGFEYRVISNFWLKRPELTEWAYTQTIRALNHAAKFGKPSSKKDNYTDFIERYNLGNDIVKCINKGNINLSHKLITHFDLDVR